MCSHVGLLQGLLEKEIADKDEQPRNVERYEEAGPASRQIAWIFVFDLQFGHHSPMLQFLQEGNIGCPYQIEGQGRQQDFSGCWGHAIGKQ